MVAKMPAPMGSIGARRDGIPGSASRSRRSRWASCSASSATWAVGSSTWLTSLAPLDFGPRVRAVANRARARAVPPLTTVRFVTPGKAARAERTGDSTATVRARMAARSDADNGSPVASSPCSLVAPTGGAGGQHHLVAAAHGHLEAPPAEVEPENGPRAHPNPGPLTDEAQSGFLLSLEHPHRRPHHPFEPGHHVGAVTGVADGGGGQCHHHIGLYFIESPSETTGGRHRRGQAVGRDRAPGSNGEAEVQEGATA